MQDILEQTFAVLSGDNNAGDPASLRSLIGSDFVARIGTNLRRKVSRGFAIEYGVEVGSIQADPKKQSLTIRVTTYGTTSDVDTVKVSDRITRLMTPRMLSNATRRLHCGLVKMTRYAFLPEDELGYRVEQAFSVLLTNVQTQFPH